MHLPTPSDPNVNHHRGKSLFLAAAAAFVACGFGYSWWVLGSGVTYPDEREYLALARNLFDAGLYTLDGSEPTARRPPGYPIVLAMPLALLDSVHVVRVLQFALLIVALWGLSAHVVGGWLNRWQAASLLLLGVLAYPVLFYTAGTIFPQIVISTLLVTILVLSQASDANAARSVAIGLLCGLIVLLSPTALCIVPVAMAAALLNGRQGVSQALIIVVCCVLVMATWTLRNQLVIGKPIVFSTNMSMNLDNAVLSDDPAAATEDRAPKSTLDYGIERLVQLFSEPGLYFEKLVNFFAYSNDLAVSTEESSLRDQVMFVTFYTLLGLVLLRLALAFVQPLNRMERLVLALYLCTALFHALVFVRIRYRIPFDLLLLLPACNAVTSVIALVMLKGGRARDAGQPVKSYSAHQSR